MRFAVLIALLAWPMIAKADHVKIAVMPTRFLPSASKLVEHESVDETVLAAAQDAGPFDVIGKSDMEAVLGFDKQKQALGCTDTACFAEIGGALGVDRIVDVQVAKADDAWIINAKLVDIKSSTPKVLNRVSDNSTTGGAGQLLDALRRNIHSLLGARQTSEPVKTPSAKGSAKSAASNDLVVETDKGSFTIRLASTRAPAAVGNLLAYVASGYYDGSSVFSQFDSGAAYIRFGDPVFGHATKSRHTSVALDPPSAPALFVRGAVIARASCGSCSGQTAMADAAFEIVTGPRAVGARDVVFGSVVSGMDVVDAIAKEFDCDAHATTCGRTNTNGHLALYPDAPPKVRTISRQ